MKRLLLMILAAAVIAVPLAAQGGRESADPETRVYTLRLAHNHNPGAPYYVGAEKFIEVAERESNGRIKIEHYPSGQLGADRDIQEGVQIGTIDLGVSSSPVATINPYYNLLDAPYLFVSREHAAAVLDGELGAHMAKPLEALGIIHVGYWENGFRHITNNIRPINTPSDLRGIKLRTPENNVRMMTFRTYGANPVPMSFTEVFGALQQGIIDGQENPLGTIWGASLQEVQRYLSMTGHVYSAAHLLMSKQVYDSLPADLQQVILAAGLESARYTRDLGERNDNELIEQFEAAGVAVNYADARSFVAVSRPVWEDILARTPIADAADVLDRIVKMGE